VLPTIALLLAAACGGSRAMPLVDAGSPGAPVLSATDVVTEFMQSVADSNLTRMGQLWGTARGPAAVTGEPARWREHVVVMQLYLRGGTSRVIGNVATMGSADRRDITIELDRGGCTKQVPFTVLRQASGAWLVTNVDISQAGNPARPCGVS
ncbi:MAG: hypothetical protein KJZ47_08330, partial [Gemmatimonadales bacterium]|nr:hypothetical protein [Gemmatimonadales bacterium]